MEESEFGAEDSLRSAERDVVILGHFREIVVIRKGSVLFDVQWLTTKYRVP